MLGAINVGINIAIPSSPIGISWSTAPISALSLALASMTIYAVLCAVTYAKIRRARNRGGPSGMVQDEKARETDAEDSQRQAWAQLLSPMPSFSQGRYDTSTYRIDIPDNVRLGTKGAPDIPRANSTWSSSQFSLEESTLTGYPDSEYKQQLQRPPPPVPESPPPNPYSLTPNAAALQEARERALERSRRDKATNESIPRELASSEAQSPDTPAADKPAHFEGAVYRPVSESVYSPGYEGAIDSYLSPDSPKRRTQREELDAREALPRHWA